MTTTQDLVLDRFEREVERRGLKPTLDFEYSNTGRVNALDPATLDVRAFIEFQFNSQYFSVGAFRPGARPVTPRDFRSTIGSRTNAQAIEETLTDLDTILGGSQ